ncbi:hypothetical protein NLM27_13775 [Bradyrhizobium sp. CCGB12]|uniref:hypothetical protein n=1 Tax=Bradyrhizobium sp. CCGB12 TaxID=2949632 RepID=UPI0020B37187|nr:hypothetical protein [Bradyrhizobium sp. CCGB12]MCP3389843.1 hypothetical protein [Bradyrhizobium sp. CCGB12]
MASVEALLSRRQAKIDTMCEQRDAVKTGPGHNKGKVAGSVGGEDEADFGSI